MSDVTKQLPDAVKPANPLWVALTLIVAWVVPGGGFLINGRVVRGLILLGIIGQTFYFGAILDGGLVWPVWGLREPGFNIVNNLSFIIQLGAGLPALLSLAAGSGVEILPAWLAAHASSSLFDRLMSMGMINILSAIFLSFVVAGVISINDSDTPGRAIRRTLWRAAKLMGGMAAIGLVVLILSLFS